MVDRGKWEKWVRWAEAVRADLEIVVDHAQDFSGFANLVDENRDWILGNQGAWFIDFVRHSYAAYACMGVRRQLKNDPQSVSLVRLMREVAHHADTITFDVYATFHHVDDPSDWDWRISAFGKLSSDGNVVSRPLVEHHLSESSTLNAAISEMGDRAVAHNDKRGGSAAQVTFGELQESIRRFDELAQIYLLFFTGVQMGGGTLGANLLDSRLEVFRHPLLRPPKT